MKSQWALGVTVAVALLFLAVGLTQAQGPQASGEGSGAGIEAAVGNVIPIQGRLTDGAGNPLNGNYSITARIYDVATGGTALCSDTETVAVNNGLFTMNVNNCTSDDIDGRQLYLGIRVGSDAEMTPRQAIYPVPYAMSLMPGAKIEDTTSSALLTVINHDGPALRGISENRSGVYGRSGSIDYPGVYGEGTASAGVGVYGVAPYRGVWGWATATSGGVHGVYGKTEGDWGWASGVYGTASKAHAHGVTGWNTGSGIGVYGYSESGIAIKAAGTGVIQSTARSYLWISGNALQKANSADTTVFVYDLYGGYQVKGGSDWINNKTVLVPVTIPGQLYGQNITVTGLDLYYNTSDDLTGITVSAMRRQNGVGAGDLIFRDETDYVCPVPARCVKHWDLTQNNVLSDERGVLYIAFQLSFASDTAYVNIGGVRLTLEHD